MALYSYLILDLLQLFKNVAERGHWAEMLAKAHRMYKDGNIDGALLLSYLTLVTAIQECRRAWTLGGDVG